MSDCAVMVKTPGEGMGKSKIYSWAAGSAIPIDLADLFGTVPQPSAGGVMRICGLRMRVTFNISTGVGNSLRALQIADIVNRIDIADKFGPRLNLFGREWYELVFMELQHPRINSGLAVNTANQTGEFFFYVPIDGLYGMANASETWWDVEDTRGGVWTLTCSGATLGQGTNTATVNSGTFQWFIDVIEEPKNTAIKNGRTGKARTRWWSASLMSNQQTIATSESSVIRYAWLDIGVAGANQATAATWAVGNLLDSATFRFAQELDTDLRQQYQHRRQPEQWFSPLTNAGGLPGPLEASGDINPFLDGTTQILWTPRPYTSLFDYPVADGVSFRTSQTLGTGNFVTANGPTLVVAFIEDRPAVQQGSCGTGALMLTDSGPAVVANALTPAIANTYARKIEAAVAVDSNQQPIQLTAKNLDPAVRLIANAGALGSATDAVK